MSSDPSAPGGPYVFDTNVLVSALLFAPSRPRQAFDAALAHGQILTSLELLSELNAVLSRPKFNRYLLREERARFLQAFIQQAVLILSTSRSAATRKTTWSLN